MGRQLPVLENFYYLHNFKSALQWLESRYADLLLGPEIGFIRDFLRLPLGSQALLVRLIMRKGTLFRASKIAYHDIDDVEHAISFLVEIGWIDPRPTLSCDAMLNLITLAEAKELFPVLPKSCSKAQASEILADFVAEPRSFEEWRSDVRERAYAIAIAPLCTRLRLLFFGNFSQDWSEFVLADLGIFKYEAVSLGADSRAFQTRHDIETFFALYECRRQLQEEVPLDEVLAQLPPARLEVDWLESRRAKLMFKIAQEYASRGEQQAAIRLYLECRHPGARLRAIRLLEIAARHEEARRLAQSAVLAPESDAEAQRLPRILQRLDRQRGAQPTAPSRHAQPQRLDLIVPRPATHRSVEMAALEHIRCSEAPVYYVENTLINALFGLHFWEVIFAPVSGAFFHPFHWGPEDLFSPTFRSKRAALFEQSFDRLDNDRYQKQIMQTFRAKRGIQSPFVSWRYLTAELLQIALECIPAAHLRRYFSRLLSNLRENRSGMPDLIQFWVAEKRYRMIEVKGPGDRLQDNQRRWMQFCLEQQIPVSVCHVRWA
jgi:hypothetical protein